MTFADKAERFAKLHIKGAPLVLYNAWDAGNAKVILEAGGPAIATSSWAVAEAQGYRDGESIPRELVERIVSQPVSTIDAPVSVDFEGGYAADEADVSANVARLLDMGAVGINFEDRVVKGKGLYDIEHQARPIAAMHPRMVESLPRGTASMTGTPIERMDPEDDPEVDEEHLGLLFVRFPRIRGPSEIFMERRLQRATSDT